MKAKDIPGLLTAEQAREQLAYHILLAERVKDIGKLISNAVKERKGSLEYTFPMLPSKDTVEDIQRIFVELGYKVTVTAGKAIVIDWSKEEDDLPF